MKYPSPAQHKSVQAFRAHLQSVAPDLDCAEELLGADGPLGQPARLGDRVIGNRFATQPMEGWDATRDGRPTEDTLRRWRGFGASGAKLVWGGEAYAVQEDGRASANQLFMNPAADPAADLAALLAATHTSHVALGETTDDMLVGLQLTHSGRFSRPDGKPAPLVAYHHPVLDARAGLDAPLRVLTDGELEAIGVRYVETACLAQQAGFDFVDVKCCHGYLLHELLGARARDGVYGGSFAGRTRLFSRIVDAIRAACPGLEVAVRVSIADIFPYSPNPDTRIGEPRGWDAALPFDHGFGLDPADPRAINLEEPFQFLQLLQDSGVQLVNLTLGSPYYCPHLQRPARYPPSDGYQPPEDPLAGVAEHLRVVRRCKEAFPDLILVGTGYSYLQEYLPHVAQYEVGAGNVDLVGLGRMALVYPDLARDVLRNQPLATRRICRTFSDCTTAPRNGMKSGCYPLDPHYRDTEEGRRLKEIKKSQR